MVKEGNKAPDFSGKNQDGKSIKLSSFKSKKIIVLYFYPKDMTPGCTTEACDFRDQFKKFKNTMILGVSIDPPERHQRFIDKYDLPFELISDENKKIVNKYGVWQEKKLYGKTFMGIVRSTFIIDKNGVIRKIFPKVKVKGHVDEVLQILKEI
ncbi:MAG: thioredoxin-dependent thiol peroxidase [Nitrospinaceae bacterium]|jgi:peroxiredoxin Q/BCP|nr:thioredoxin-dependent thiol peroxidase [Nitrospinaceae bacterium]MDP6711090.1 thioredoxin-dependent thiol peroxidase [Nitrospinaceae bacterium]MDP7058733.1 thioredoxin-dependent thiol peroxidase [Nitrospinaceae bacterium]HAK38431.1 thioredoxin-dependent thiol peroxidase [Nitrospina sp.]|tara:strand:+ start:5493 stop:5951 length:459 start_codon:yes stop_codon:yes gene_type:complete